MGKYDIKKISARQILDSRGNPTIEAKVVIDSGFLKGSEIGYGLVPSGASTGAYEAHELRDGDPAYYGGKGVLKAIENVNTTIADHLEGQDANQESIDQMLIDLDGTPNKSNLGANAILAVSLGMAHALAKVEELELWESLTLDRNTTLPVPMCNIINGGAHAANTVDIQEFMIMPIGAPNFSEGIRWCTEIFHSLKKVLKDKGLSTNVGDEGGFAPNLKTAEEIIDTILLAIKNAGYNTDTQIKLAIDAAASEWANKDGSGYTLPKSKEKFTTDELIKYWANLCKKYPIISLEDALGEDDFAGWAKLTALIGDKVQIVGDDLLVTNMERLQRAIDEKCVNSILIKMNQIGSITETIQCIELAQKNGLTTVISHRSGETEDASIADLAVATGATQIKTGGLCRSDRVAKYNRLLKIEHDLNDDAIYAGVNAFPNLKK